MDGTTENTVTLDRPMRALLTVIAGLLAVIAVELWVIAPDLSPARAQIPDTGRQRQDIVNEAQRTNALLSRIAEHLETKPVKVTVVSADKTDDRQRRANGK